MKRDTLPGLFQWADFFRVCPFTQDAELENPSFVQGPHTQLHSWASEPKPWLEHPAKDPPDENIAEETAHPRFLLHSCPLGTTLTILCSWLWVFKSLIFETAFLGFLQETLSRLSESCSRPFPPLPKLNCKEQIFPWPSTSPDLSAPNLSLPVDAAHKTPSFSPWPFF